MIKINPLANIGMVITDYSDSAGVSFKGFTPNGRGISCGNLFTVNSNGLELNDGITSYVKFDLNDTNTMIIDNIDDLGED